MLMAVRSIEVQTLNVAEKVTSMTENSTLRQFVSASVMPDQVAAGKPSPASCWTGAVFL